MSQIVPPRAPRSMAQTGDGKSKEQSPDKILDNAAKELYPKLALFESLTMFKDEQQPREQSCNEVCEARRDFLDSFAYLCDIMRHGSTVTADGLQELEHSNILWLAANGGISSEVKRYADNMRKKLQELEGATEKVVEDVQNYIFKLAIQNTQPRLLEYKKIVKGLAIKCRMDLRQEQRDGMG
jgi:hypothetical protein